MKRISALSSFIGLDVYWLTCFSHYILSLPKFRAQKWDWQRNRRITNQPAHPLLFILSIRAIYSRSPSRFFFFLSSFFFFFSGCRLDFVIFVRMCNLLVYFLSLVSVCARAHILCIRLQSCRTEEEIHSTFFFLFLFLLYYSYLLLLLLLQIQIEQQQHSGFAAPYVTGNSFLFFFGVYLCNCSPVGYCVYLSLTRDRNNHGHSNNIDTNKKKIERSNRRC